MCAKVDLSYHQSQTDAMILHKSASLTDLLDRKYFSHFLEKRGKETRDCLLSYLPIFRLLESECCKLRARLATLCRLKEKYLLTAAVADIMQKHASSH